MIAQALMCVSEAVPGDSLTMRILQVPQHDDGLSAVRQCLMVVAEAGLIPADCIERSGLAVPVPGGPEQFESNLVVM